jgi:FkbM family methyltransferase
MGNDEVDDLIFDVGAHTGEDSEYYLKLGYRVLAIEANPVLADNLRIRFTQEIRDGRYMLIERAISNSDGPVTFFINEHNSAWGTANPEWAQRNKDMGSDSERISVQPIRFIEVLKKHGCPHYLKIDVEGADMLCVDELHGIEARPRYISLESSKTSWPDLLNEFRALASLGYTKFAVVDQRSHSTRAFRHRNGQIVNHAFERGSTGPFGEHLQCRWLSKEQAFRRYVWIFFLYRTLGDNTLLSRLIDRIPVLRRGLALVSWYDTHATRD